MTQNNQFISDNANLKDLTNSATSKLPANPKQNVDAGKKNEDLANKTKLKESNVPTNKKFNKDVKNDSLEEKVEKASKVPSNKKFNKPHGKTKQISKKGILERIDMEPTRVVVGENNFLENARRATRGFVPQMGIRDVYEKLYMEAEQGDKPLFSLDLGSLVMDKLNCKFNVTRNNKILTAELMYPNASQKLSIRIEADGMGTVDEISLDSDEYRVLGDYIKKLADDVLEKSGANAFDDDMFGDMEDFIGTGYNDEEMANVGAVPGNELVRGDVFSSFKGTRMDSVNIQSFKSLMEADEDEDTDEVADEVDAGDVNADSEEFDVADLDAGGDDIGGGAFDDMFGGDDSLGDLGGSGAFDVSGGGGEAPEMASGSASEDEEPTAYFKEKEDGFDNAALVGMEKLLASEASKASKRGSGLELSPHESFNGTRGISGKYTNRELIDQFLKVYPELDEIEIPTTLLNDIEDKLSQQDSDSFDEYLKGILPEIRGEDVEVDFNALNNDMFNDFEPMGGEEPMGNDESFGEFDFGGELDGGFGDEPVDEFGDEEEDDLVDLFDADLDAFNDIEPDEDDEE